MSAGRRPAELRSSSGDRRVEVAAVEQQVLADDEADLAEHRKAQASPNSAGSPTRPAGIAFARSCTSSSTGRLDVRAAS